MPEFKTPPRLSRRQFLKSLGIGTTALALSGPEISCWKRGSLQGQRPNLIYMFADQLRYGSLGYAGDKKARTPRIDSLAGQGVSFCNAVSTMPVCAAHRASLFTGKYPSTTGMVINELRMNPNHRCFAHVLTDSGYETGYIGKWHLWANQAGHHDEAKNSYIPPEMRKYRLGFDRYWAAYNFNHLYYKAFYFQDSPERIWIDGYEPDVQTDMAISFLEEKARLDRPFALFLSYGTSHDPWRKDNVPESYYRMFDDTAFSLPETWSDTPDPYMDRFTDPERWLQYYKPNIPGFQRVYYAMVANLDWNVGRLMDAVGKTGIANNTVVVFSSDHGEMFGAHGRVQKLTFYDEAVRVPFLIRWPGKVTPGSITDACLGTPDIMPTVLGLMGLPVPEEAEGMALDHLARGEDGPEPDAAFLQGMGHTYLWQDGFEWRGLRDKRYSYAVYRKDSSERLFDNQNDPLQTKNLIGDLDYKDIAEALRLKLKEKMKALNDTFESCSWYRDKWTDGGRNILRGAKG